VMAALREENVRRYLRAGYSIVGRHSAVAICRWTRSALKGGRLCYKRWYGVRSHRCIQMTPVLNFCNFACKFCWRMHLPGRFKLPEGWEWDSPREIVDGIIVAQRRLLIGFKGNPQVPRERFLEAMFPRHVAISLDGEPTLYPMLPGLVEEVLSRGMTAFLVTNGSVPQRLREMLGRGAVPTNLYISVYGPNEEVFRETADPRIPGAWGLVMESLGMMERFEEAGSRTVMRITAVKGLNMVEPEGYARLVEEYRPMFVEFKGYTWVGESQKRLPISAMPRLEELREFASRVAGLTGYVEKEVDEKSRVVMLVRDEEAWERSLEMVREWRRREEELDRSWRGRVKDFRLSREGVEMLRY